MISELIFLLFCGPFVQILGNAEKLPRVKRQSLKVQINATGDAVCMRYVRPSPSTELEGFILGYGSSFFSNQYISLPSDGKTYITEVDAEPRYLIAVRPAPVPNYKKSCSGKTKKPKPLQLVIGTLTPTSVFLSWGILVNPSHDWTTMNSCANDRFYTVRYREKDKNKKWVLQLCPTTETVIDNLKPNAIYDFGVKDNIDNGIWSKIFTHKVAMPGKNKENGQLENSYKFPKIQAQFMPDSKTLIPVKVIKQVLQNITHRTQSKIPGKSPLSGPILVHLIVPDFNGTQQKLPLPSKLDIFEKPKKTLAMNKTQKWLADSKTSEVQEITPQSEPALTERGWESNKPTAPSVSEESVNLQAHTESEQQSSKPSLTSLSELPLVTLALHKFPELPKSRPSPTPQMSTEPLASSETQQDTSKPQTPVPKTIQTKPVFSKTQPAFSSPQTSDEIAMSDIKPAIANEPTLASLKSKTSRPLDSPRATLAPSETSFIPFTWKPSATPEEWHEKSVSSPPALKQSTPKTSRIAEKLKASPAGKKESQQKTTIPSTYKIPELPRTTMAVTSKLVPVPATTKISATVGHPLATMVSSEADIFSSKLLLPITKHASYGPTPIPSKSKETYYTVPEVPSRKPVTTEADYFSSKLYTTSEFPFTKPASYDPSPVPSKPKEPDYTVPEISDRKPVSLKADSFSPKLSTTPELPVTKPVSTDADSFSPELSTTSELPVTKPATYEPVPSKRKEPFYTMPDDTYRKPVSTDADNFSPKLSTTPELPVTKPESYEPSPFPPKSKEPVYIIPEVPDRKPVSTEADNFFPKLSTTPELPFAKPVLEPITFSNELPIGDAKDKHHLSIPKTTVTPYVLHPKPDPKETHSIPTKPKTPLSPGTKPTKPSLKVNHDVSSKPKTSPSPKAHPSRSAPKETQRLPSKPKPSDKQEVFQTKPVMHKTPAPGRPRISGEVTWSKIPRGDKLTNEDHTKLLSTSSSTKSSISLETSTTRKKTEAVATPPGSPRPPLAPARPTPVRRKPLPPNTVTGKPGRSGNVLTPRGSSFFTTSSVAKPTWPSSIVKTSLAKKLPTAAASPDYSNPMFSSLPTSETDIAGTPRYTGDHVKYLQKEDDVPCSITDTLQHFPTEEGENMDMVTAAPQKPPTNLTVVTVEGCPSFIILDWQKPENETVTEYKVVSTENGGQNGNDKSVITTNQTHSTVENLKPNTSYEFVVIPSNPLGEGPSSESKPFRTESADPRVTESISMGKDAIWTEVQFNSDDYSECKGKQYVKRTWYKKFVGVQLCNSLRYKIYLSDSLTGTFYNIGDQRGHGEDHCQFVDSYLDGRTGQMLPSDQLPTKEGYFRAVRQEPVNFGKIGAATHITYVHWYECGTTIPGKW